MATSLRMTMRASSLLAVLFCVTPFGPAFAHAQLRSAEPPVGGSVHAGVHEIRISYSEAVEPRFCHVAVTGPDGKPVKTEQAKVDPANAKILVVPLDHALPPGAYKVAWHATAVDTHKTEGSYNFTVTP